MKIKNVKAVLVIAMTLISVSSHAAPEVLGLVCENRDRDEKIVIDVEQDGKSAVLSLRGANSLSPFLAVYVKASEVAPILKNDLAKLDRKTIKDEQTSLSFQVDGYDYQMNPRLAVLVKGSGEDLRLSSCNVALKSNMSPY